MPAVPVGGVDVSVAAASEGTSGSALGKTGSVLGKTLGIGGLLKLVSMTLDWLVALVFFSFSFVAKAGDTLMVKGRPVGNINLTD